MEAAMHGVEGVGQHVLYVPGSEIVPAPPAVVKDSKFISEEVGSSSSDYNTMAGQEE